MNARSYLLDAGFISLHYAGNLRAKRYFDRILSGRASGFISEVNLAEFYYKTAQKMGLETAETWYNQVRQTGFQIIAPDSDITRNAAIWKTKRNHISLADCFALATLKEHAEVLLTTDSVLGAIKEVKSVHISPL